MDALTGKRPFTNESTPDKDWKFSDLLADHETRERWEKVRKYFFLRESTYDMSNRCNIRCEGCYYYEGDKQFARENKDPEAWRELMRAEKKRGITYVVLAGAEPSMVSKLCEICYQEMPLGTIASNGLRFIPESIQYKIHISVWGNDETSLKIRNAKNMLRRQINKKTTLEPFLFTPLPATTSTRSMKLPPTWPNTTANSPSICFPSRWGMKDPCAIQQNLWRKPAKQ